MESTSTAPSQAQVKLVIWDLDETLWDGVLSEGRVTLPPERAQQLERLIDHGVMVSISSRNDEAAARVELEQLGIWGLVIFPRINWESKGGQIRDLIEACQLRPANVLFVDDNHLNREEALYFVPGLQTIDPADPAFEARLESIIAVARADPTRRRLGEYRILEAKASSAASFASNEAFLRSCDIQVIATERPEGDVERLVDLIARANQLNYTKRAVDEAGLVGLLADPDVASYAFRVTDTFGDYGLVGFAAVRDGRLEQFVFSCRVLGMGIERALHAWLGEPAIEVVEPVSASLDGPTPDWLSIRTDAAVDGGSGAESVAQTTDAGHATTLFVGGCDLQAVVQYLARDNVTTHFNCTSREHPRVVVHRDSIDYLLSDTMTPADREAVLEDAFFLDASAFQTPDWSAFDHIVYSPLIDYVQAKYASDRVPGLFLSYGDLEQPVLDEERVKLLAERLAIAPERIMAFAARWKPTDKPDAVWIEQLRVLFQRMSHARTVTVLMGATKTFGGLDESRLAVHRHANDLIRSVASDFSNVRPVAVDDFIRGRDDFTDSIRHYGRQVSSQIAVAIANGEADEPVAALRPLKAVKPPTRARRVKRALRRGAQQIRQAVGSAASRV